MQPAVLVGVLALAFAVGYVASVRWLWFALATFAGFGLMGALLAALWYDGRTVTGGDTVLFQGHWIDRQLSGPRRTQCAAVGGRSDVRRRGASLASLELPGGLDQNIKSLDGRGRRSAQAGLSPGPVFPNDP